MDSEKIRIIGLSAIGVILFISFFLIGFSVTVLEPLQYGLEYNQKTITLDTGKVWYSGRYWQGLGMSFVSFPMQQQIMIFSGKLKTEKSQKAGAKFSETNQIYDSINCRSVEGITLTMDIFMAYRLTTSKEDKKRVAQLAEIHANFGTDWNTIIRMLAHAHIRNVASRYKAFDFFQKREEIGEDLFKTIEKSLFEFHFNLVNIFMINLQFPPNFEEAIMKTQIVVQETQTIRYLKEAKQIEAETKRLEAQIQKTIITETKTAEAEATFIDKSAIANATRSEIDKQRETLEYMKKQLGFKDEQGASAANKLLTYLWIFNVKNYPKTTNISLAMNVPEGLKF